MIEGTIDLTDNRDFRTDNSPAVKQIKSLGNIFKGKETHNKKDFRFKSRYGSSWNYSYSMLDDLYGELSMRVATNGRHIDYFDNNIGWERHNDTITFTYNGPSNTTSYFTYNTYSTTTSSWTRNNFYGSYRSSNIDTILSLIQSDLNFELDLYHMRVAEYGDDWDDLDDLDFANYVIESIYDKLIDDIGYSNDLSMEDINSIHKILDKFYTAATSGKLRPHDPIIKLPFATVKKSKSKDHNLIRKCSYCEKKFITSDTYHDKYCSECSKAIDYMHSYSKRKKNLVRPHTIPWLKRESKYNSDFYVKKDDNYSWSSFSRYDEGIPWLRYIDAHLSFYRRGSSNYNKIKMREGKMPGITLEHFTDLPWFRKMSGRLLRMYDLYSDDEQDINNEILEEDIDRYLNMTPNSNGMWT